MSSVVHIFTVTLSTSKAVYEKRVECRILSIGRAEDNALRINNAGVADHHISFTYVDGALFVEDHGSVYGTRLDGQRIEQYVPYEVSAKSRVLLGQTGIGLLVSVEAQPVSKKRAAEKVFASSALPTARPVSTIEPEKSDYENFAPSERRSGVVSAAIPESFEKEWERTRTQPDLEKPVPEPQAQAVEAVYSEERAVEAAYEENPGETESASLSLDEMRKPSEHLLLEAQGRASAIIQAAELAAEKKVEEIFRRAEETEQKAAEIYKRKLHEAYGEAEEVYEKSQKQASEMIESARKASDEMRNQVESAIAERRKTVEAECERNLEDAQAMARKLKENRLLEADAIIKAKEDELLGQAQEKIKARRIEFELELQREAEKTRAQLNEDLKSLRAQIESAAKERAEAKQGFEEEFARLNEKFEKEQKQADALEKKNAEQRQTLKTLEAESERNLRLQKEAQQAMDGIAGETARLKTAAEDLLKQIESRKSELAECDRTHKQHTADLEALKSKIEAEQQRHEQVAANFKLESEKISEQRAIQRNELKEWEQKIKQSAEAAQKQEEEFSHINTLANEARGNLVSLQADMEQLQFARDDLHTQADEIQNKLAYLQAQEEAAAKRLQEAQENLETEKLRLREDFEKTKIDMDRREQEHLEQLRLEMMRKLKVSEQDFFSELDDKKNRIASEMTLTVERFYKENPIEDGPSSQALQRQLAKDLDAQITVLSRDPGAEAKGASLLALKRRERWRLRFTGVIAGALSLWACQTAYILVTSGVSPIERRVAAVAEERKRDLEQRRFNPPQSPEVRATYTDSVIYTMGFAQTYMDDEFQKKFLEDISAYMFKTWRLEEEKTIQMLASSASLVKELADKKQNIHPDFVEKDLQKMRELEDQTKRRMIELGGTEVRYESFKKRERDFFVSYRNQKSAAPK